MKIIKNGFESWIFSLELDFMLSNAARLHRFECSHTQKFGGACPQTLPAFRGFFCGQFPCLVKTNITTIWSSSPNLQINVYIGPHKHTAGSSRSKMQVQAHSYKTKNTSYTVKRKQNCAAAPCTVTYTILLLLEFCGSRLSTCQASALCTQPYLQLDSVWSKKEISVLWNVLDSSSNHNTKILHLFAGKKITHINNTK